MPGKIVSGDVTDVLISQTYWPSYNVPFFTEIFNYAGYDQQVKTHGEVFSYDGAPRAKIFKRDNGKVTDLESYKKLMRYN